MNARRRPKPQCPRGRPVRTAHRARGLPRGHWRARPSSKGVCPGSPPRKPPVRPGVPGHQARSAARTAPAILHRGQAWRSNRSCWFTRQRARWIASVRSTGVCARRRMGASLFSICRTAVRCVHGVPAAQTDQSFRQTLDPAPVTFPVYAAGPESFKRYEWRTFEAAVRPTFLFFFRSDRSRHSNASSCGACSRLRRSKPACPSMYSPARATPIQRSNPGRINRACS